MKIILTALLTVLLIGLAVPALDIEEGPVRIAVRIFKIPAEQSFRGEMPDGRGGKISMHATGNINSVFPDGTLFLPTELAWNASDSAIGRAISERAGFGCGNIAPGKIQVRELKSLEFSLEKSGPGAGARFEETLGEGRALDYNIGVELLPDGQGEALVRIRFDAGWSASGGSIGAGFSESVISTVAAVPESRLLLVGAPGDKAVYFVAVCVMSKRTE
jgi:hypothetical protein